MHLQEGAILAHWLSDEIERPMAPTIIKIH